MDINKEILISKVFSNSVIWDKRLKGHANRNMVDKAWQSIAAEMGLENGKLKTNRIYNYLLYL